MTTPLKIDASAVGFSFAEEETPGVLPAEPVWYSLQPDSYSDFGANVSQVARSPISPSRSRKRGTLTDIDAMGGFTHDLTHQGNLLRFLQGYFFASLRQKKSTTPMNGAAIPITAVNGTNETYAAASGLTGFQVGHLVKASGFTLAANNGIKPVTVVIDTLVTTTGLETETPSASAKLEAVGWQTGAGVSVFDADTNPYPRLIGLSDINATLFGLVVGEWIYLGGDASVNRFENNVGWARVRAIGADYLEFDKTSWTPVDEDGAGKYIRVYFGSVLKNEVVFADQVRRTYNAERILGNDGDGDASEYLTFAVPNELTIDVKAADKVTITASMVACDHEFRTGAVGVKTGTRSTEEEATAYNTSTDFSRQRLALVSATPNQPALFAHVLDASITLKNNVTPTKAIGTLGAFEQVAGMFEVSGKMTVYFCDTAAVSAIRSNSDVTFDFALTRGNEGLVLDMPLMTLGDGRLKVEKNKAIDLPLSFDAVESPAGHTLLINSFPYLPTTVAP